MSELTYEKLQNAWDAINAENFNCAYTVYMTEHGMRDRGYSSMQIVRMKSGGELEIPEDKEKFNRWWKSELDSRKR